MIPPLLQTARSSREPPGFQSDIDREIWVLLHSITACILQDSLQESADLHGLQWTLDQPPLVVMSQGFI